jgi:hypothetical protein
VKLTSACQSVCSFVYLSVRLSICLYVCLSVCTFIYLSVPLSSSNRLSNYLLTCLFDQSNHLFNCLLACMSVHLSINFLSANFPSISLSVCPFVQLFPVYSFVHLFLSFVHTLLFLYLSCWFNQLLVCLHVFMSVYRLVCMSDYMPTCFPRLRVLHVSCLNPFLTYSSLVRLSDISVKRHLHEWH